MEHADSVCKLHHCVPLVSFGQLSNFGALSCPINANKRRNHWQHNVLPLVQTCMVIQNIWFSSAASQGQHWGQFYLSSSLNLHGGTRVHPQQGHTGDKTGRSGWCTRWLCHLFRGTLTAWRNGSMGISWISTKGKAKVSASAAQVHPEEGFPSPP